MRSTRDRPPNPPVMSATRCCVRDGAGCAFAPPFGQPPPPCPCAWTILGVAPAGFRQRHPRAVASAAASRAGSRLRIFGQQRDGDQRISAPIGGGNPDQRMEQEADPRDRAASTAGRTARSGPLLDMKDRMLVEVVQRLQPSRGVIAFQRQLAWRHRRPAGFSAFVDRRAPIRTSTRPRIYVEQALKAEQHKHEQLRCR